MNMWILWGRPEGQVVAKVVETFYGNDGCLSSVYEQQRESALWELERWSRKRMMKAEEQLNLQTRARLEASPWCEVECVGYLSFEVYHPPVPVPRQAESKYD